MASGKWELERIITHEFPLNELEQAIRTASDVDHLWKCGRGNERIKSLCYDFKFSS